MRGNRDRNALMAQVLQQYQQQGSPPGETDQALVAMMGGGPMMARSPGATGQPSAMPGMMGQPPAAMGQAPMERGAMMGSPAGMAGPGPVGRAPPTASIPGPASASSPPSGGVFGTAIAGLRDAQARGGGQPMPGIFGGGVGQMIMDARARQGGQPTTMGQPPPNQMENAQLAQRLYGRRR